MMMVQKWLGSLRSKTAVSPENQTWYAVVALPTPLGTIESAKQRFENIDFFNQIALQYPDATHLDFFSSAKEAKRNRYPALVNWAVVTVANLPFELEKTNPAMISGKFPRNKQLLTEMIKSADILFSDPESETGARFVEVKNPGHSERAKQRNNESTYR